ncbi:hypothetical protein [Ktedonobacter robiniae]|uniref:YokE-like PH domain-containing protein n=1 Tax=Ktedonobacter robiniae TaxID=2778365 RepID=A0ABQ3V3Y4_9CHLR|nr:hypothetical protein [Ktedonobacter robiniae]GHO59671.1 hypothetical protein KSB_81460 [Ktedonobacter robiniae]
MSEQQPGEIPTKNNSGSTINARAVLDAVQAGQIEQAWKAIRPQKRRFHDNNILVLLPEGFIDYNPLNNDVIRRVVVINYSEVERMTVTFSPPLGNDLLSLLGLFMIRKINLNTENDIPQRSGSFEFTIYLKKGIREEWCPRQLFGEPYDIVRRITDDYQRYRRLYGLDD